MSKEINRRSAPLIPMGRGMMKGEKAKDFRGTMKRLVKYLKPYKWSLMLVLVFAIFSTTFNIVGPKILGRATNKLFEGLMAKMMNIPNATIDFNYIGRIAIWLLILYIVSAVFAYIQGYIMSKVSQDITYSFRKDITNKINRIPLKYFDTRPYGDILSRVTNDIDLISTSLNQSMIQVITSITMVVGILIMMLTISIDMTMIALVTLPITFLLVRTIIKYSQKYFKEQQALLGKLNGHIEEMYSGHIIVKAFNREEHAINQFNKINNELYTTAWKSQFLSGLMMPITHFISNLGFVGVCIMGGYLAVHDKIKVGDIQAFIQYVRQFNHPIAQTANIANILQSTAAAAERVFEFLDVKEEVKDISDYKVIKDLKGNINFDNIVFGYDEDNIIIKNFSIDIKAGQKVAIVGPTGAGKTTIVNLLMRFYDVQKGSIKIDGIDIKEMRRFDLRKMLGMVLQDTWLFNASIKDNIAYGKLDATDEEIEEAATLAQIDHFIHTLPEGYNTIINEDASNISSGEKQLLTIARAILTNPAVLILDEATSSVDTRTEVLIQEAMHNLMKGRTSFIIAHRLSTIRNADLILVISDGKIIEQGTHDELLAKKGFYSELYNSQFGVAEV
jgi:ATP-binding cassette subfamily B multidrug efflux pump